MKINDSKHWLNEICDYHKSNIITNVWCCLPTLIYYHFIPTYEDTNHFFPGERQHEHLLANFLNLLDDGPSNNQLKMSYKRNGNVTLL